MEGGMPMNVKEAIELCNAYIEPNIHPSRRLSIDKDFMELITVLEECKKQEAKIKQFHEMLLFKWEELGL